MGPLPEIHHQAFSFAADISPAVEASRARAIDARRAENLRSWTWDARVAPPQRPQMAPLHPRVAVDTLIDGPSPGDPAPPSSPPEIDMVRSPSSARTRVNERFGCQLRTSEQIRSGETFAGEQDLRRGEVQFGELVVVGKRKRAGVWVRGIGRKARRRLSGLRRKSSSPKEGSGTIFASQLAGVEGGGGDVAPLIAPEGAENEQPGQGQGRIEAGDDGIVNAHPSSPPPYRSHSPSPDYDSDGPPARPNNQSQLFSDAFSPSSADWHYQNPSSWAEALTARLWEREARGDFDSDVLDFQFESMHGNQEDGVSSLFYWAGEFGNAESVSGGDGDEEGRRRTSEEEVLEESWAHGPEWARGMRRIGG